MAPCLVKLAKCNVRMTKSAVQMENGFVEIAKCIFNKTNVLLIRQNASLK